MRDPRACPRKCRNSFSDKRPCPSAMLLGIETAARRNCDVSPNCSSFGKAAVARYVAVTRSIAFCQAIKSLYDRPIRVLRGYWQLAAGGRQLLHSEYFAVV